MPHEPFRRNRPPLVRQTGNMSCWAAALVSWLGVSRPGAPPAEEWLLAEFRNWQAPDGSIHLAGLRAIANRFGIAFDETGPGALNPAYLCERLRRGHLYLTYAPGMAPDIAHTVVVYAVGPVAVDLMDPFAGYTSLPFAFFASRERAFVAWPRNGPGGWAAAPASPSVCVPKHSLRR